jgi:hypothetical protein
MRLELVPLPVSEVDCAIRPKTATRSGRNRPPNPEQTGHPFRLIPATPAGGPRAAERAPRALVGGLRLESTEIHQLGHTPP